MHDKKTLSFKQLAVVGACALAMGHAACAQEQPATAPLAATHPFDIPAGDLAGALRAYIAQCGAQVVYKADDVKGLASQGARGELTDADALSRLLEGTRLKIRRSGDGAIVVFAAAGLPDAARVVEATPMSVIVTASRRHEPAREVPMTVNAISSDALEREGAKNLADYVANQPGINLASAGTVGGQLSMRGVTTGLQSLPTVGVYVDDVATGSTTAYANGRQTPIDMGLLDLRDVEILRGPQGTLYGAGAMGGLLKYTTNDPDTLELSGRVGVSASSMAGGGINNTVNGVVNIPLKENVAAIRIAGFRDHVAGYYDAVGPAAGRHIDRGNTDGERISALLTPVRHLTIKATAMTQDIKRDSLGVATYDPRTRTFTDGDLTRTRYTKEPYTNRIALYGLDIEYDFGWARLNSITSAQATDITTNIDISQVYVPVLQGVPGLPPLASVVNTANVKQNRLSQELRLTSRASKDLEWLGGLYFNKERGANDQYFNAAVAGAPGDINLIAITGPSRYRELAAYGDLTWHLSPKFELTGGLRVSRNHQEFESTPSGPLNQSIANSGQSSQDSNTFLAAAKYALTKESNVYFRAASGYRPGGPSGVLPNVPGTPVKPTFKSDSLWSYEAGYKGELADHTLSVEATVFDIEWRDLQQPVSVGQLNYIVNGGRARIDGAELTLTWAPAPSWRVGFSTALTDARLLTDAPGLGASAGQGLPDNARVSATTSLNHDYSLFGYAAYSGISARYVGRRDGGFAGSTTLPSVEMPAYALFDLQSGIDFKTFTLGAYVRNVGNKRAVLSTNYLLPAVAPNLVLAGVEQPRTIGLSLSAAF